jgi:hypothetical protein
VREADLARKADLVLEGACVVLVVFAGLVVLVVLVRSLHDLEAYVDVRGEPVGGEPVGGVQDHAQVNAARRVARVD